MKKNLKISVFYVLIFAFLPILAEFFVPAIRNMARGSILSLIPVIIFSLLGVLLLVLIFKEKQRNKLNNYLLITGYSSAGFFVAIFLHNALHALGQITQGLVILNYVSQGLGVFFFLTAIIISPLGFIIGTISVIVLLTKKKK